jgi:hypothetical protein
MASYIVNECALGKARRYFIRRDGKYYDSKAIAGAAMGYQDAAALNLRPPGYASAVGCVGAASRAGWCR